MRKNELIIFVSCLIVSFCAINIVNAQWDITKIEDIAVNAGLSIDSPADIIDRLTNWVVGLVVAIGILAIIWAGINYVSSGGDAEQATTAKKIIKYALLGIIVAGIAYALVDVFVKTILV